MKIIKNGLVRFPNGRTWLIQRPLSGNGVQLRTYMEGANGFSQFGLTEPAWGDTAWSKVLTIGKYVFRKMYWTGSDNPTTSAKDALDLLQQADSNASLNGGKGQTFACQTVSFVMMGICVAYGVVARLINGACYSAFSGGSPVDVTMEVFIPEFNKWVWWHAPTAGYVLLPDGVTPAGSQELKYYYSNGLQNLLTFKSGMPGVQQDTGYEQYGLSSSDGWWQGITGGANDAANKAHGGFFYSLMMYTQSGRNYNGGAFGFYDKSSQLEQTIAIDSIGSQRPSISSGLGPNVPIVDMQDAYPTFNTIQMIRASQSVSGFLQLDFDHSMLEFDRLQTSQDNATWTDAPGLSVQIPQFGSGQWYIRGVDVHGVPSNVVQISY